MPVYVDAALWPFGRMTMCHMVADTSEELNRMAELIGVHPRWIQYPGTPREHYDICKSKRAIAVKLGAKEVTAREFVAIQRRKREEQSNGSR